MATWLGLIVDTRGVDHFWERVERHGIKPGNGAGGRHALIEIDAGLDVLAPMKLGQRVSRELTTECIAFIAQTTSDVYSIHTYRNGVSVRSLDYSRDSGGWLGVEGEPQAWERAFFFGGDDEPPDMLISDASPEERSLFDRASASGDVSEVLELIQPSSVRPLQRLCESMEVDASLPAGRWKRPSMLARLLTFR